MIHRLRISVPRLWRVPICSMRRCLRCVRRQCWQAKAVCMICAHLRILIWKRHGGIKMRRKPFLSAMPFILRPVILPSSIKSAPIRFFSIRTSLKTTIWKTLMRSYGNINGHLTNSSKWLRLPLQIRARKTVSTAWFHLIMTSRG